MPSPFPGMNPYLEQSDTWKDFHHDFITRAREVLSPQVGPNYLVKIEARLYLHELSEDERHFFAEADVGVLGERSTSGRRAAVLAAPVQLTFPTTIMEEEIYLEIRDLHNRRVITVVELLSPSNKSRGADQTAYLGKRSQVLASSAHFVEIDLLRGGARPTPPELPACDYYSLISLYGARRAKKPRAGLWPIGLRDSLPVLPIPLADPDPPVHLDLKAVLDRAYDAADYGKYIYRLTPEPPLSAEDASWAQQFLPTPR